MSFNMEAWLGLNRILIQLLRIVDEEKNFEASNTTGLNMYLSIRS